MSAPTEPHRARATVCARALGCSQTVIGNRAICRMYADRIAYTRQKEAREVSSDPDGAHCGHGDSNGGVLTPPGSQAAKRAVQSVSAVVIQACWRARGPSRRLRVARAAAGRIQRVHRGRRTRR